MQNRTQGSRLDFEAPLISARRRSVPPAVKPEAKLEDPAADIFLANSLRSTVPFYKSELKSGPFRSPGVIPFVWEKKPGQPRAGTASRFRPPPIPLLPPGKIPNDTDPNGPYHELQLEKIATETPVAVAAEEFLNEKEEDNFSDAVKALSCTESFFMNCSFSGLSGIPDVVEPSESFSTDPQVRALMMDRFLPAAQAMATSSPQCPPRKPPKQANCVENRKHQLLRAPLPYQHRPNFVAQYPHDKIYSFDGDDDEYDDNCKGNGHFTLKACGLLPRLCMKNSFCLLNPLSGMKVGGRHLLPPSASRKINSIMHSNVPLTQAKNEPWGSVNKLEGGAGIHHQKEGRSKITSKSNQHVQWSNSQALGGSSSCRDNRETLVEIIKRDIGNEKSDMSDSLVKDGKRYSVMSSSHESQQGSCVFSPKMLKDVLVDSGMLLEVPHSIHGSTGSEIGFKSLNDTSDSASVVSDDRLDNQRMEENLLLEGYDGLVSQPKISRVLETDMGLCSIRSSPVVVGQQNAIEHAKSNDGSLFLKGGGRSKNNSSFLHSLLPPPLPKTPSESWLSRTLPSVSTKIPLRQSIFDIHVPSRKQAFHSSSTISREGSYVKPLEPCHLQISSNLCEPQQCQVTLIESEEGSVKHSEPHGIILDIKPSKPPRRQIRFADVLMTPLSPRSEM